MKVLDRTFKLSRPDPDLGQREKINLFYFHTSLWRLEVLRAFMKPFEARHRRAEIKI